MRVLEVLSHVRVLVDTSRRVELQRSRLFIGRAAETPLTTHHCSWKVGSAATTHAHDRCARARTDTDTTTTSSIINIITLPPLIPSCDRSHPPQLSPSPHRRHSATAVHRSCCVARLCSLFSFRVYVPVYAVVVSVVCVLARTNFYYYYY